MFQQRLAEEMKRRRKEMGITQEQLAEMIDSWREELLDLKLIH